MINNNIFLAPLFKYLDLHSYFLYRLLMNNIYIYTGMIHTSSYIYNYKYYNNFLSNLNNKNTIIQFVGNNYKDLYKCVKLINIFKFSEINFNLGCSSKKAKNCNFGIFLMDKCDLIINCLNSIKEASDVSNLTISLKHRIGLYDISYNYLLDFVGNISLYTSCNKFIIHARNILKNNFSTYINLNKPILKYNLIYKLKKDLPHLNIVINGNIKNLFDIKNHLLNVDGVMIGRGIYFNPLFLVAIKNYIINENYINNYKVNNFNQNLFFNSNNKVSKYIIFIFYKLYNYMILQKKNNINLFNIIKHVIYIFNNIKYASLFRSRILNSLNYFDNFNSYLDFINFVFKDFI